MENLNLRKAVAEALDLEWRDTAKDPDFHGWYRKGGVVRLHGSRWRPDLDHKTAIDALESYCDLEEFDYTCSRRGNRRSVDIYDNGLHVYDLLVGCTDNKSLALAICYAIKEAAENGRVVDQGICPLINCPTCKKEMNYQHLHDTVPGMSGVHKVGSERYKCVGCGRSIFKHDTGAEGLEFFLD